jgi:hypothetical protein
MVGVSPASVVAWTRDIVLTPEQNALNLRGPRGPQNAAAQRRRAATWSRRSRARREAYQEEGRARAREGDPLHLAGCMLYWAEGKKGRNTAALTNSDRPLVVLFRRFLTESLGVEIEAIGLSLNVYTNNGLSIGEIERYWLAWLELPDSCLRKHMLNHMPTSSSGRARNKLPYGVCTIRVNSTRIVQHIFGAIQEYGGFEEHAWLDSAASRVSARGSPRGLLRRRLRAPTRGLRTGSRPSRR